MEFIDSYENLLEDMMVNIEENDIEYSSDTEESLFESTASLKGLDR